jgi:hypothetical protein
LLDCPCRGVETLGGLAKVARAHDIVSLEHAPGLVSRHPHRDALRDASADEIADGGSAEVVQDATRASGFHICRSEGDPEAFNGSARTVEHTRADHLQLPLEILGDRSLLFKHFTQLTRHRERPSLAVLGLSGIEPDFAGAEVDLPPLKGQNLAVNPPAAVR